MLLQADARALPLADASVQCVITSPPYLGLRDYQLPPSVWDGGDPACAHVWGPEGHRQGGNGNSGLAFTGTGAPETRRPGLAARHESFGAGDAVCARCGAWRGVLGLEPTPELYVAHMVTVFREVRRVLRDDGVVWLNLGDSYAGSWGNQGRTEERGTQRPINGAMMQPVHDGRYPSKQSNTGAVPYGLKPKDLVGIPWRVAFALQADGWYLRADVIWAKPNPMPESVTDRPTKSHEYLFLLTKAESYFYDAEAIKEPQTLLANGRLAAGSGTRTSLKSETEASRNGLASVWRSGSERDLGGRNRRSVWTIATEPYPEAHFATFPEALVVPCILAGTSEAGACAVCGAPWARVVEHRTGDTEAHHRPKRTAGMTSRTSTLSLSGNGSREWAERGSRTLTTGWRPTCAHADAPRVPCTVLDPFGGTATVGAVAERLGRRWVATDLKPEYLALARRRTAQRGLPFLATLAAG